MKPLQAGSREGEIVCLGDGVCVRVGVLGARVVCGCGVGGWCACVGV